MKDTEITLHAIVNMLGSQKFYDWYVRGRFDDYITGEDARPTRLDDIYTDLRKMMRIEETK